MKELTVGLGDRSYNIKIQRGLLDLCGEEIRRVTKAGRLALISDSNVAALYLERVKARLESAGFGVLPIVFEAGEKSKNINTLNMLYETMALGGMTRGDGIVALGGGVTGDIAGFAAATMFRGIDFIQIPTTILAQVDSSVGGKTAIDLPQGKNLVGAFYQPKLVLIDADCLSTLTRRVKCDGMGEVIKYGMISNRSLFEKLEKIDGLDGIEEHIEDVIYACCADKSRVVAEDERDMGRRAILNFGHTLGHAYELAYNYETYTHGEGVAAGMVKILEVEQKLGYDVSAIRKRLCAVLESFDLPTAIECSAESYAAAVGLDKKAVGSIVNIVEVTEIGAAAVRPIEKEKLLGLLED